MSNRLLLLPAAVLVAAAMALVWFITVDSRKPVQPHSHTAPTTSEWRLRFGHNTPVDSSLHAAAERFASLVAERSRGQVIIEVFPAQQLGNDHQMVEMARRGELDIVLTPTAKMSVPVPAMQYADLPFYFPSRDDLYAMLDGEPGQLLLDKLRTIDLVGITFWENGFKQFTANRPLLQPNDFADLKIRTMKSRIIMQQFRALDAHPIPIDFHATRDALADGVVDGQENPLVAIVSMGFHQVQSDLTLSNHAYLGYVLSISAHTFEKLPQAMRTLLLETARELTPWERKRTHEQEQQLLETIRAAGVQVHTLSEAAHREFTQRLAHIPEQYEAIIGPDLLSLTDELLRERHASQIPGPSPLLVGLNADLSSDSRFAGLAIKRGAQLAINEINAAGGAGGRPLRLWARDHHGIPARGIDNLQRFIDHPDVVAVVTGLHSPVVSNTIPLAHSARMPLLAAWSAAAEVTEHELLPNPVFRLSANDRLVGPFLMDYLVQHYQRPVLIHENSLWGRGNLQRMSEALTERGLSFVDVASFNRAELEFIPIIQRIQSHHPDVIVIVANPEEGGALLRQLAQLDSTPPVISHWGVLGGDFWSNNQHALSQLDLTLFQTFNFNDNPRKQAKQLASLYRTRYGLDAQSEIIAAPGVAQSYDLVHLLARAITQANSHVRSEIRDALEQLEPMDGAVKRYNPPFTRERHDALDRSDYHLVRYSDNGHLVSVTEESK